MEYFLKATKPNGDFIYASTLTLVEVGVPEDAAEQVLRGMGDEFKTQGYIVEVTISN